MTTANPIGPDASWSGLSALDEEGRRAAITERYRHLVSADESQRLSELEGMVRAEYQLADAELYSFTLSRLRAWIQLRAHDPGQASALARAYDQVFRRVPGELAMRRAAVVQTVARTDLQDDEVAALEEMVPALMQSVAHRSSGGRTDLPARASEEPARRGPRWKFW